MVERRDPMKKAERSLTKVAAKSLPVAAPAQDEDEAAEVPSVAAPGQAYDEFIETSRYDRRKAIPASIKHAVFLRDQGRCVHRFGDGSLCGSRSALELDHRIPVARGGTDIIDNLELKCREHNAFAAVLALGQIFMGQWDGHRTPS